MLDQNPGLFHIVLFEPQIPQNTGNVIRLSANIGAFLHLIHPLGFDLSDKHLRRAGMDYRELATVKEYASWEDFSRTGGSSRVFALSTKGCRCYADVAFHPGDALVFGPETRGLPLDLMESLGEAHRLYVPMVSGSRSLNLSNTVALVLYEAWRQCSFAGTALRRSAR